MPVMVWMSEVRTNHAIVHFEITNFTEILLGLCMHLIMYAVSEPIVKSKHDLLILNSKYTHT